MKKYLAFAVAALVAVIVFTHIPPTTSDAAVPRPMLAYSGTLNVASLLDGAGATHTIVASNARLGDTCTASMGVDLQGILLTCYVSAIRVISVRFQNETAGTLDLASTTLRVNLIKADPLPVAGAVT